MDQPTGYHFGVIKHLLLGNSRSKWRFSWESDVYIGHFPLPCVISGEHRCFWRRGLLLRSSRDDKEVESLHGERLTFGLLTTIQKEQIRLWKQELHQKMPRIWQHHRHSSAASFGTDRGQFSGDSPFWPATSKEDSKALSLRVHHVPWRNDVVDPQSPAGCFNSRHGCFNRRLDENWGYPHHLGNVMGFFESKHLSSCWGSRAWCIIQMSRDPRGFRGVSGRWRGRELAHGKSVAVRKNEEITGGAQHP